MILKEDINIWFLEIKKIFLDNLNNKLVFEKKLDLLTLHIKQDTNESSHATLITEEKENFDLYIFYNPDDNENFVKLVIAHELCHLLFVNTNKLIMSGYCSTDDSFAVTNVTRKSGDVVYGESLEEILCDYIGLEIVYRMNKNILTKQELIEEVYSNELEPFTKVNLGIAQKLILLFGNEFSDSDKLDDYSYQTETEPKNFLLYSVISGTLELLVNDYDECMGKESWKYLNLLLNRFFTDNLDEEAKEIIFLEMKRFNYRQ